MTVGLRNSGIGAIGGVPWGTHISLFYRTGDELLETLARYFKAGLENNEACVWVTSDAIKAQDAARALKSVLPSFDACLARGQISIIPHTEWYLKDGCFDKQRVLKGWHDKHAEALSMGFKGLRVTGDTSWLDESLWAPFSRYEKAVEGAMPQLGMLALCTYQLEKCEGGRIMDVVYNHRCAIGKRDGRWAFFENPERNKVEEDLRRAKSDLEERVLERTADLRDANMALQIEIDVRKKMEAELRSNYELLQGVMDNSPAIIIIKDTAGRYLAVNRRFVKDMGLAKEDVLGKTLYDIYPYDTALALDKSDRKVIETGLTIEAEEEIALKDGVHAFIVNKFPMFSQDGGVQAVCGIATDITERKRMEQARERLTGILEATPDFVATVDPLGNVFYCNKAAREMLGIGADEDVASISILGSHPQWAASLILEQGFSTARRCGAWSAETAFLHRDGREIPALQVIIAHKSPDGAVQFYSTVARDISGLKRMEAEKGKIQAQLFQAQKMETIGKLAGGIAHDFNNIMTIIGAYCNLAMKDDRASIQGYFEQILAAAERATNLTRQLLIFSRNQPTRLAALDVNSIFSAMLKILDRIITENITVAAHLEDVLPAVMADKAHMEQILMNLVINAKDALPNGGNIIIKTESAEVRPDNARFKGRGPGKYVCLTVEDNGVGMDRGVVERLFEPFFSTKGAGKGIGLGLAVVKDVVKGYNGWIDVQSEPGRGSIFRVYLPAIARETAKKEPGKEPVSTAGAGERILLVEDEKWLRKSVALALYKHGYRVFEASSANDALGVFENEGGKFDIVFSDMILEDGNGISLVEELKRRKPGLRVLLVSGYLDIDAQWPVIQEKGYRFLQKPYDVPELLQVVREVISRPLNGTA